MGTKARPWSGHLTLATALAFYIGSQGGKAFVLKQTRTVSLENVSASPGKFAYTWISKANSSFTSFLLQNQTRSELEAESSLTSFQFGPLGTQATRPRTADNLRFITPSSLMNLTSSSFARSEPLHTVGLQDHRENLGHQGSLTLITQSSLMKSTSSAITSSEPPHTVDLTDHQDSPTRRDSLTQQDTTTVGDLCSARMVPGFSSNVSGNPIYPFNPGFYQYVTYRVVAVGPFAWDNHVICFSTMTYLSDTVRFVFWSTHDSFCWGKYIELLHVLINLLSEHCPTAHLTDIFKYPNGVMFQISNPNIDGPLRTKLVHVTDTDAMCHNCFFLSAVSGVYWPRFQVNYTNVSQGMYYVYNLHSLRPPLPSSCSSPLSPNLPIIQMYAQHRNGEILDPGKGTQQSPPIDSQRNASEILCISQALD